jgi:hypothetical protein
LALKVGVGKEVPWRMRRRVSQRVTNGTEEEHGKDMLRERPVSNTASVHIGEGFLEEMRSKWRRVSVWARSSAWAKALRLELGCVIFPARPVHTLTPDLTSVL